MNQVKEVSRFSEQQPVKVFLFSNKLKTFVLKSLGIINTRFPCFISTVKDMPIKRLEHNIDEKKKKTTNSVEEFQKVSKALCHTGEFYKN